LRGTFPEPCLKIYGNQIPVVEQAKFLGVIFDKQLSFLPHIYYLKDKCLKALNLLKVISSKDWGGDRTTLLRVYRSHIRSKLDYGSVIYGSARVSYISKLDPIQNQALRLCTGAFRTSPIDSLQVEAGEPPLYARRRKLSLFYVCKLKASPGNPAYTCVLDPSCKTLFDNKPKAIAPLGIRILPYLEELPVKLDIIGVTQYPKTPPWVLETPKVIFELTKYKKAETSSLLYKSKLKEILHGYPQHKQIFTDGSKEEHRTAMAFVSHNDEFSCRITDHASISTAELMAIKSAMEYSLRCSNEKVIIMSDSLSSLQAIQN
jgi:hypothetical protein